MLLVRCVMICQSLIFILLFLTIINGSEVSETNCDAAISGEFVPENWISNSLEHIQGLCPDSYIKIDIIKDPNSDIFWLLGSYFF